jgi:hypothetical protein
MTLIFGLIITMVFTIQRATIIGFYPDLKLKATATYLGLGFGG